VSREGFTPREPANYPLALLILVLLALLTSPWYAQGPAFERLVLSIPLWAWCVILWTVLLAFTIMAVAKYLWRLEPESTEEV